MKNLLLSTLILVSFFTLTFCNNQNNETHLNSTVQDSLNTVFLIEYLRANFDDIHDVSMRFHHKDHTLNGMIQLHLFWQDGKLDSARVGLNETGDENFPLELIKKIDKWKIDKIKGSFDLNLPLRIKIVGSDDSTFAKKGIFTGKVADENGKPLNRVKVHLTNSSTGDTLRNTFTNREGIFVRTLIPVGKWNAAFSKEGYKTNILNQLEIQPGRHIRREIKIFSKNPN